MNYSVPNTHRNIFDDLNFSFDSTTSVEQNALDLMYKTKASKEKLSKKFSILTQSLMDPTIIAQTKEELVDEARKMISTRYSYA